jgi:hypothetical protein
MYMSDGSDLPYGSSLLHDSDGPVGSCGSHLLA